MLRTFLYLVIATIGLAMLRNIVREIGRIIARTIRPGQSTGDGSKEDPQGSRKLVQDPQTGTYIDPAHAIRATVGGTIHYFESEESRDAFLRSEA